jgi:hypothetical protein
MIAPADEIIEGAVDQLFQYQNGPGKKWLAEEEKELRSASGGFSRIGIKEVTGDVVTAYQLGLEVARRMIAENVQIITKGVNPQEVL